MVISNGLAEDTELQLIPRRTFFGYKGKKEKKRERVTGGASEHIDI